MGKLWGRGAALDLRLEQPSLEEARWQSLDRLQVVRAKHPTEVVVQLQVGRRARRLVHRADDVGALERRHAQEAVEDVRQTGHVVQIVQDDDRRQLADGIALALLRDVGQVLLQLFAAVVVHTAKFRNGKSDFDSLKKIFDSFELLKFVIGTLFDLRWQNMLIN